MARRTVDTALWADERFTVLSPDAMLIFFRLVSGDDTGPAGATRVTAKRLAVDTNMTPRRSEAALEQLVESGLVRRYDGAWLWLPAWIRYQVSGPSFIRAVRRQARECPDALRIAIGRAIDAHAPKRDPDKPRTEKSANSSENADRPPEGRSTEGGSLRGEVQDQDQDQDPPLTGEGSGVGLGSATPPALGGPASPTQAVEDLPEPVGVQELSAIADVAPEGSALAGILERRRLAAVQAEHAAARGGA